MAKNNWVCAADPTCAGPFAVWRTPNDPDRQADTATCDVHARPAWRTILRTDRKRLGMAVGAAREYVSRTGPHAREFAAALRLGDGPPEHQGKGSAPYYYSEKYLQRGGQPPAEPGARAARKVLNRAMWSRTREQERQERRRARFLTALEVSAERSPEDERSVGVLADEWIANPHT